MAFSNLLELVGDKGLFHALLLVTILLPSCLLPWHLLLENFSAAIPSHRCWTPLLDNSSMTPQNLSLKALLTVSIPPGPHQEPHQCLRFRHPQWQLLDLNATATSWSEADTEPCVDGWVYNTTRFTSTIVSQWDLVCHHQYLKPLAQSIFMAGLLLGSIMWGVLSDRIGRRRVLVWGILLMAVTGSSTVLAWNLFVYCALRFLTAFLLAGIIMTSGNLTVEWVTTPRRTFFMTAISCSYSTGQVALGGLAFALRDWRTLQLAVSVPFFAFFLICWWLPESARWLIIMGKADKGLQELKKVARINGREDAHKKLTMEVLMSSMREELDSAKTRQSLLDLFRLPVLRWRILGMITIIFSITFSYYGLVLDLQSLGSDIFLLQVLFGAVDFLGRVTTPLLLRFLGRRMALASSSSLSGLAILVNILVPQDLWILRTVFAVLGKGAFGISLTCYYLYKTELFPTSLRMTADGVINSASRLGGVMGPLIRMTRQALPLLPPLSYGIVPIVSSFFLLVLPETQGLPLPDTVQNLERQQ
ncbi:PREDICTED: solute carrier family 22 member 11 [Elephantulus edwardii]|uniref:solute carrier family 22 member 11 n=1 Tax=Elephantulus edwardii TaxID=28737 RepID=UPI0003F064A5|nr:PREDICTED: solute carrier family 22 member 11 [Elephantulus edwardii]